MLHTKGCSQEVSMLSNLSLPMIAALSLVATPPAEHSKPKKSLDPNEKVCETIKPLGSRLVTKKVCATRAEWDDYRRQDRDAIEKAQRVGCMVQGAC
jgi:hypothetical protein